MSAEFNAEEILKNLSSNVEDILNENNNDHDSIDIKNLHFLTQKALFENDFELDLDPDILMSHVNSSHEHFKALANIQPSLESNKHEKAEEFIPHYHNPIDFVNYMERVYIRKKLEANENIFQLKNYKYSKSKVNVLQFLPKPTLSSRIFRKSNVITSIASSGEMLLSGNNLGVINKYSCDTEYELETFSSPEIEINNTRSVVCMDISNEKEYLISGYSNGFLALWDFKTAKCKKIIKEVHKDCVITCCFLKAENKTYDVLSADLQGHVYETVISEGFFSTSIDYVELINNALPIFLIEVLKYTKEDKSKYPFCNTNAVVVAFGSLENIRVYQIEPVMKELLVFERPIYKNIYFVPDIAFGIGYPPKPTCAEEENDLDVNLYQPQSLFAISWDNIITLYIISLDTKGACNLIIAGHYVNSVPILRMGFLSSSIIYFFDKNKNIKIINASLITFGDIKKDPITEIPIAIVNSFNPPELEEGLVQDTEILFQTYIPDLTAKKKFDSNDKRSKLVSAKATYNRYILSQPKTLFLLGKKQFHYGKLLNWEQCLNSLQQNSESMMAMSLGLDIFHGRLLSLPDIPTNEDERKKKVEYILKGLIIQYALINTEYDFNGFNPNQKLKEEESNDPFIKCINICIEFCIEINNFDLLMTELQPMFDAKNYGEIFIERLEPFILCDKIDQHQLGNLTISKIIDIYIKKSNYQILSQILIHLDIKSIDEDNIKEVCFQNHLITPLIYIYMNGKEEDYFSPIHKIFEIYLKMPEFPLTDFGSYTEYLKHNGINKLEQSKPYIGHKLLWYINMCFNGDRFLSNTKIQSDKHARLVNRIVSWMIQQDIFETLLEFDSYSLFYLLNRVFLEEKLSSIIDSPNTTPNEDIMTKSLNYSPIDKLSLCNLIIKQSLKSINCLILEDFYRFIAKISVKMQNIDKKVIIKTALYLLSLNQNRNSSVYFSIHKTTYDDLDQISLLSLELIDMMESRDDLENEDLISILIKSELSPYVNFTLYLLNKIGKYNECLQMFINDTRIDNRIERTFDWIEETLMILYSDNKKDYESLQAKILDYLSTLADLSIDKLTDLITTWFNANHNNVIQKLKGNDQLQLLYVDKNLETFKEDELRGEDLKNYEKLLTIHMELLFRLNKQEEILTNLQKRQMYPTHQLLERCKNERILDAAFFLFKKTGGIEEAMNYFIEVLNETFHKIINSIKTNESNDKIFNYLSQHREHLNRCIEICEINSDKSNIEESEAMWFKLLQIFYDMLSTIQSNQSIALKGIFDDLTRTICRNIKEILEKMVSYVRIQEIIDNVTCNYKQAEFKEFKKLLVDVLSSYSHNKSILVYATKLVELSLGSIFEEYNELLGKGNHYCLDCCDDCKGKFDKRNKKYIYLFRCGHKIHDSCTFVLRDRIVLCPACKSVEDQNSIITKTDSGYIDQVRLYSLLL